MSDRVDVVIVGAGQAGLAISRGLTQAGVAHVVLERGRVGQTWRGRWDSFCLVTPNWFLQLPGHPYDGGDPDGFMPRDEVVAYLERYAAGFEAPVREGIEVTALRSGPDGGFLLCIRSSSKNCCNPADLPAGPVLVVGSSQSGCQIAEELHAAGRDVFLACGRAPWMPRRLGDRDLSWWALETDFLDASVSSLPSPAARLAANVKATGAGGGHDLHYRTLRKMGVTLLGRFLGADGRHAGFRPDYESWVRFPGAFDELGFSVHEQGASTVVPGLYFVGVHFLRKRKSSLLNGVGDDAAIVAGQIAGRRRRGPGSRRLARHGRREAEGNPDPTRLDVG